jgi:hypothetical protein
MRVKVLLNREAPATIRDFLSRLVRERSPIEVVERRKLPYWQERGWQRNGRVLTGSYQTRHGSFQGSIEERSAGHIDYFLYNPSREIREHSHWVCFQHRGNDWYFVHMGRVPADVSSGILTIERLITEAYEGD